MYEHFRTTFDPKWSMQRVSTYLSVKYLCILGDRFLFEAWLHTALPDLGRLDVCGLARDMAVCCIMRTTCRYSAIRFNVSVAAN